MSRPGRCTAWCSSPSGSWSLGLVFRQLKTLVLAVLIVVDHRVAAVVVRRALHADRASHAALGATVALLIGLGVLGGLITLTVPVFSHQVNQFVNSLPGITDSLRHRLAGLTGTSPTKIGTQIQHFVDGYTQHPTQAARAAGVDRRQRRRRPWPRSSSCCSPRCTRRSIPTRCATGLCGWCRRRVASRPSTSSTGCAPPIWAGCAGWPSAWWCSAAMTYAGLRLAGLGSPSSSPCSPRSR